MEIKILKCGFNLKSYLFWPINKICLLFRFVYLLFLIQMFYNFCCFCFDCLYVFLLGYFKLFLFNYILFFQFIITPNCTNSFQQDAEQETKNCVQIHEIVSKAFFEKFHFIFSHFGNLKSFGQILWSLVVIKLSLFLINLLTMLCWVFSSRIQKNRYKLSLWRKVLCGRWHCGTRFLRSRDFSIVSNP